MARIEEHTSKLRAVLSDLIADGYRLEGGEGWIRYMDVSAGPDEHDAYLAVVRDGKPSDPNDIDL